MVGLWIEYALSQASLDAQNANVQEEHTCTDAAAIYGLSQPNHVQPGAQDRTRSKAKAADAIQGPP